MVFYNFYSESHQNQKCFHLETQKTSEDANLSSEAFICKTKLCVYADLTILLTLVIIQIACAKLSACARLKVKS